MLLAQQLSPPATCQGRDCANTTRWSQRLSLPPGEDSCGALPLPPSECNLPAQCDSLTQAPSRRGEDREPCPAHPPAQTKFAKLSSKANNCLRQLTVDRKCAACFFNILPTLGAHSFTHSVTHSLTPFLEPALSPARCWRRIRQRPCPQRPGPSERGAHRRPGRPVKS